MQAKPDPSLLFNTMLVRPINIPLPTLAPTKADKPGGGNGETANSSSTVAGPFPFSG